MNLIEPSLGPAFDAADERLDEDPGDGIHGDDSHGEDGVGGDDDAPDSEIILSEEGGVRYLHFGSQWVQGAMRLSRPFDLELDYVKQMMAWQLFLSPPAEILQLGLGAGALTKFCHRYLSDTKVTAVERDPAVIDAARRWFHLPADDDRLQVVCADAAEYLTRPEVAGRFGVIQVDLYDSDALGPVLDSLAFYRHCRVALAPPGIVVLNLFGRKQVFQPALARLRTVFDDRVLSLAAVPAGNVVTMVFDGPPLRVSTDALLERAMVIEKRYRLPARKWLQAWGKRMATAEFIA